MDSTELEDIYLPYKPKRRTRAQIAREQGLEPLALAIMEEAKAPSSSPEGGRGAPPNLPEPTVTDRREVMGGGRQIRVWFGMVYKWIGVGSIINYILQKFIFHLLSLLTL